MPLFPGMNQTSVLELQIASGDRRFDFRRSGSSVSVNGHIADSEIFDTLLEQVAQMPVIPRSAFSAQGVPVMTISISIGSAHHSIRFYPAQEKGQADVLCTLPGCEQYGVTDAWRLGTLLLTCDGTRILDEHGSESPAR